MECQFSEVSGLAVRDSRILLAVPEAELQLEACPVVFKDIDCRLSPVCREVELPFVGSAVIGIPDGKADHSLEGLGPGFQPVQLSFVGFMLRTSGGVKSREVYGAIVQFGATSPPCRFFRRGIEEDRIVPEPADDMEAAVAHRRDECAL